MNVDLGLHFWLILNDDSSRMQFRLVHGFSLVESMHFQLTTRISGLRIKIKHKLGRLQSKILSTWVSSTENREKKNWNWEGLQLGRLVCLISNCVVQLELFDNWSFLELTLKLYVVVFKPKSILTYSVDVDCDELFWLLSIRLLI